MSDARTPEFIETSKLNFDPENPRFSRFAGDASKDLDVIEVMIRAENVAELMGSIGEQGFFEGEPLLVAKDSKDNLIVVEGNRRLAALKLLNGELQPPPRTTSIDEIKEAARHKPTSVPCMVFEKRKEILRYLGYRHITGPKRWDSLSKARYIKQLRAEFYTGLPEDEQLRAIAKEIGSRKDYVAQMLTGLSVYERTVQKNFFDLQLVKESDISFSVLTTALSYNSISDYIGLDSRLDIEAENIKDNNLKDLIAWSFAQDQQGDTILGESRNLRKLAAVVSDSIAVKTLKETKDLGQAYLQTEGPAHAFETLLASADTSLKSAIDVFQTLRDVDASYRDTVDSIVRRADSLGVLITTAVRRKSREASE